MGLVCCTGELYGKLIQPQWLWVLLAVIFSFTADRPDRLADRRQENRRPITRNTREMPRLQGARAA